MPKTKIKKAKAPEESKSPWKARLQRMLKYQKENSQTWDRNRRLFFGSFDGSERDNEVAYGWALMKNLETSIYVQNPEMALEPYDGTKMETARLLTQIVNYDIDQMDLKSIGNLGLSDIFVNGYFVCVEDIETKKKTAEIEDDDGKKEEAEDIEYQECEARRIPPKDFLIQVSARKLDLSDADYIACAWYPTIEELRDDPEFRKNLPDDIDDYPEATPERRSPSAENARGGGDGSPRPVNKEKDPAYRRICCWEIWDKVAEKVIYVLDHQKKEIGTIDWPIKLQIGRRVLYPVTVMAMHPQPDKWYPKPELDLVANQLMQLNKIDSMIMRDALTKWRKFAAYERIFTSEQIAKLTDPSIMNAVLSVSEDQIDELATKGHGQLPDIDHLVGEIKDPAPNKDLFPVREMIKQEMGEILGYGPADRGGMPKTRSAKEAMAIKDRQDQKLAKRADAVGDFYRWFGQKHVLILQKYLQIDKYVRVMSESKNLAEFKKYTKDDIQGQFNFIVYAGTSQPRSTEAKKAQEVTLYQTLMPLAMKGMIPPEPIVLRLAQAHQWKGTDALLRNYKPAVKNLAMTLGALRMKKADPAALLEAASAAVQAVLTPEELQMLAQQMAGGGAPGAAPGQAGQQGDPNPQETAGGAP